MKYLFVFLVLLFVFVSPTYAWDTPTPPECQPTFMVITPTMPMEGSVTPVAGSSGTIATSTGNSASPIIYGPGSSTQAPSSVTCTVPFSPPMIVASKANGGGSLTFYWLESAQHVQKYSIVYGYSPTNLVFGEDNIPNTSTAITINDLTPGNEAYGQIWSWVNGCAEKSNVFEPFVY